MGNFNATDVWNALLVILALCAAVVTIGGAVKVFTSMAKPGTDARNRITNLENRVTKLEGNTDDLKEQGRMTLKALNALIGHEINGVSADKLQELQQDITDYLIEK